MFRAPALSTAAAVLALALAATHARTARADDDDSAGNSPADSSDAETPPTDASAAGDSSACARGSYRADPAGHCCAPGQRYRNGACAGTVTSCAPGFALASGRCSPRACTSGRVRAADGVHCCWPGQNWSDESGACTGDVAHCLDGTQEIAEGDCAPLTGISPADPAASRRAPAGTVFVPGGTFRMNTRETTPARWVTLGAFYVDRTEVTNAAYARCVAAGACSPASDPFALSRRAPALPVVNVTHAMAETYCTFAGGRLPTEAEWEFAARGADGRTYPWGERAPDCNLARSLGCGASPATTGSLAPGASPFGALDMAGNVAEWTADVSGTEAAGSHADPWVTGGGNTFVVRGGAFDAPPAAVRTTARVARNGDEARYDLGFRCVRTAP